MNNVEFPWVLVLEFSLPFILLSIVLVMVIIGGRKKFKEAAKRLILSVKTTEDSERDELLNYLSNKLGYDEKQAKKKAKKIINERKFLIRNMVSGLLDKNVEAISQLNNDLSRVTDCYKNLEVIIAVAEEQSEAEPEIQESAEEKELRSEIKSLKQEVHITLTTLNNIFKEFSSMFGEDDIPQGQMSVDQIITAMESFSGKSVVQEVEELPNESLQVPESVTEPEAVSEPEPEAAVAAKAETETEAEEVSTKPETEISSVSEAVEAPAIEPENQSEAEVATETVVDSAEAEELDFAIDSAIDDIDSALDGLELDASDEEPDWGDAFAESGDKMEDEPK